MIHNAIENNPININLMSLYRSRGYTLLGESFSHIKGYDDRDLIVNTFPVVAGGTYNISFYLSGTDESTSLEYSLGGISSLPITTDGFVQSTIIAENSSPLTFKTSGNVTVSSVTISREVEDVETDSEATLTFSEDRKGWVTFKSIVPDCGFSMYTHMFTYKDGHLWKHTNEGTVPNNIHGNQYFSTIKFPISSVGVKTYHSIAIHANKVLGTTENGVTTELGNVTDLITYDFTTSEEGVHYANKLRDQLLNEKLKGRYIVVELSDEETKEQKLQLFKIVMKSEISTPSE